MDKDFIVLPASPRRDGAPSRLDAVFAADGARERARGLRGVALGLVALLSVPLWLSVVWPGKLSPQALLLTAAAWAVGSALFLSAAGLQWWWSLRRSRRVEALGPLPVLRSARRGGGACAAPAEEED